MRFLRVVLAGLFVLLLRDFWVNYQNYTLQTFEAVSRRLSRLAATGCAIDEWSGFESCGTQGSFSPYVFRTFSSGGGEEIYVAASRYSKWQDVWAQVRGGRPQRCRNGFRSRPQPLLLRRYDQESEDGICRTVEVMLKEDPPPSE